MIIQNSYNAVDSLFNLIDSGKEGKNIGLTTGMPKLDEAMAGGIQRSTFYLIGGTTGSGKSTLALYSYVFRPFMDGKLGDSKFKVLYYSLEMSAEVLYAKLLSMYIAETYSIELSYSQILSRGEILSDEYYDLVMSCKDWLLDVQKQMLVYDKGLTTNGLYASMKEFAQAYGKFEEHDHSMVYIPNEEDCYTVVILDHIGLLRTLPGQTKKDAADTASDYLITMRNKCSFTPVVIMQLNRQASSMDRRTEGMQEPELQDFKGSGGPGEAAEIVLALFYPHREKMSSWRGYNMVKLRDKFRAVFCLKNRFGTPDQAVPVNFFGNVGIFQEMPRPEEIIDYTQFLKYYIPQDQIVEKEVNLENIPKSVMYTL